MRDLRFPADTSPVFVIADHYHGRLRLDYRHFVPHHNIPGGIIRGLTYCGRSIFGIPGVIRPARKPAPEEGHIVFQGLAAVGSDPGMKTVYRSV